MAWHVGRPRWPMDRAREGLLHSSRTSMMKKTLIEAKPPLEKKPFAHGASNPIPDPAHDQLVPLLTIAGLWIVLVYSYWNSLTLASLAWDDPKYSHGWLIPLACAGLLLFRRKPIGTVTNSARWWGVGMIAGAVLFRTASAFFRINTLDMYSFVPAMMGAVLLGGGWGTLRWAGGPIAFLIFMFPLNMRAERELLVPLQNGATAAATYALQTLGVEAFREGNLITIDQLTLGVVDQCSGLRMLTIFIAMSVCITMIISVTWWEKAIIIVSAIPIALVANLTRITVTGLLLLAAVDSTWITKESADFFFHQLAGYFMMPLGMGLLGLEIHILSRLFIVPQPIKTPVHLHAPRVGAAIGNRTRML
jgi:exosortase